jgi:hypothetical protein
MRMSAHISGIMPPHVTYSVPKTWRDKTAVGELWVNGRRPNLTQVLSNDP